MDNLNKLLKSWSEEHRAEGEKLDLLARDICRSAGRVKPVVDESSCGKHHGTPRRVKLFYASSGALAAAMGFLVFINTGRMGDIEQIAEKHAEAPEAALLLAHEPVRRRMEAVGDVAVMELAETAAPEIFPRIEIISRLFPLEVIARHAAKHGWKPIADNTVRIVKQPFGTVCRGYKVNLETSEVTVLPGAGERIEPWTFKLSGEGREKVASLVKSEDFFNLPSLPGRVAGDGASYFIEADIDGRYHWLLHRQPDEPVVLKIFGIIEREAEAYEP